MKKPTKSSLTRKLDKICADLVKRQGYCSWCHTASGLECAHIFSRRYRAVRWDFDNLLCLCHAHHFYAHFNPVLFTEFVRNYLGEAKYTLLKQKAQAIKKWTLPEMEELYKALENDFNPNSE